MTERAQALEAIDRMLSYMVINAEDRRILRAEIAALPVQAPAEGVSPQPPDDEDDPGEIWLGGPEKGAPAPCVWREDGAKTAYAGCTSGASAPVGFVKTWAGCPYCLNPLTVER